MHDASRDAAGVGALGEGEARREDGERGEGNDDGAVPTVPSRPPLGETTAARDPGEGKRNQGIPERVGVKMILLSLVPFFSLSLDLRKKSI